MTKAVVLRSETDKHVMPKRHTRVVQSLCFSLLVLL
jgi:hypothetical protein